MKPPLDEALFRGLRMPALPPELRAHVLGQARARLRQPPLDLATRLWQSRPLRMAWAAVLVALVVVHVALSLAPHHTGAATDPRGIAGHAADGDVGAITSLPTVRHERLESMVASAARD